MKGEILENYFEVVFVYIDCDYDLLLVLVNLFGLICYLGI